LIIPTDCELHRTAQIECPRNEEGDVGFLVEFYVASFGSRDPENFLVRLENFRNPTHLPNQ
jgi:hypothetical protein